MRSYYKNGSKFPDLNKDGKVTKADILMAKGVIPKPKKKKKIAKKKKVVKKKKAAKKRKAKKKRRKKK